MSSEVREGGERTEASPSSDPARVEKRPRASRRGAPAYAVVLLAIGGQLLGFLEIGRLLVQLPKTDRTLFELGLGAFVFSVLFFFAHAAPVWLVGRALERWRRLHHLFWIGLGAATGYFWQATIMSGDGIRSLELYPILSIAAAIVAPAGCGLAVWLLGLTDRISLVWRRALGFAALVAAAGFNVAMLTSYRAFHGVLAAVVGGLFCWLVFDFARNRLAYLASTVVLVVCAGLAVGHVDERESFQRSLQRYTHLPGAMLTALPLGMLLELEPDLTVDLDRPVSDDRQQWYREEFAARAEQEPGRQGRNVLLVVLESTRWDYWGEAELTPRFHEWRSHGTYFPRAVAQYPATPLAYGALFTSQPPTVLAASPFWSERRPFDALVDVFDHVFLTRPHILWFEHNAITDFFVPRDADVHRHRHAPQALRYARRKLSSLEPDESFFTWVHLYEPHAPYQLRRRYLERARVPDDKRKTAYRSEIAYVDDHLGRFMEWFYEQPFADETLVVVVSDHGEGMGEEIYGEEYVGHHVHVHDIASHIPMYVSGPGLPAGVVERDLAVAQIDVLPTLYDFLDVPLAEELFAQGQSLYRLLSRRPERTLPTEAFSIRGRAFFDHFGELDDKSPREVIESFQKISTDGERYAPKIAIQRGRYKLVYDRLLKRYWLYDLREDPGERRDLSVERPDAMREMKKHLDDWYARQSWTVQQLTEMYLVSEP